MQGGPLENREFQHTSLPFIGSAYERLRSAGVTREQIITVVQLDDYLQMLRLGEAGEINKGILPHYYAEQRARTESNCRLLLEEGGADYDHGAVNSGTIWSILLGEQASGITKVVPEDCTSLFLGIYSHGDSHSAKLDSKEPHGHLTAEWFAHMPYPTTRSDMLDFVSHAGAGQDKAGQANARFYLYSTQLRLIFHQLFQRTPSRPIIGLLNYCRSGGNLEFMRRESASWLGSDRWPLFLMSSSQASVDSLVAGFWEVYFRILARTLLYKQQAHVADDAVARAAISPPDGSLPSGSTLEDLFNRATEAYFRENSYELLNHVKMRAYTQKILGLDFHFSGSKAGDCDPWHIDLKHCIQTGTSGEPNWEALRDMQQAYEAGRAFRVVRSLAASGDQEGYAALPGKSGFVVWAGKHRFRRRGVGAAPTPGTPLVAFLEIPSSRPFKVEITAWRGPDAGQPVNLEHEVRGAMGKIAHPERVFGSQSGALHLTLRECFLASSYCGRAEVKGARTRAS